LPAWRTDAKDQPGLLGKENRAISRVRVGIENLIGDMKVFQILAIKFRNHIKSFADQVILVIAGLCNLKNGYVVQ